MKLYYLIINLSIFFKTVINVVSYKMIQHVLTLPFRLKIFIKR